jgi:hypothetical protein
MQSGFQVFCGLAGLLAGLLLLSGCPRNSGSGSAAATPKPVPLTVTISGGQPSCPVANVKLTNATASVTTTSGQTLLSVSITVECDQDGKLVPVKGAMLVIGGIASVILQPNRDLGPTDDQGVASKNYTSSSAASDLANMPVSIDIKGSDGNNYPGAGTRINPI